MVAERPQRPAALPPRMGGLRRCRRPRPARDLVVQLSPAGDAAVASYRLDVETKGTDGASTRETLQETDVLFRGDAGWRIVHLHYSLPSPTQ
jgi:ketosteroid isomerase-like protein